MSSLGLVWSIAKDALAAQRYGMDVTAHNIANVGTAGYSRQIPVYETKDAMLKNNLVFGRGVDVSQVIRKTDQFIESQLRQQQANLIYSEEMELYGKVLEGIFNESSGSSVSAMLSDFWNMFQDISNNPTGLPERSAFFEHSLLLSGKINSLDANLTQMKNDLTGSMSLGINKINEITAQLANLNNHVVGMETGNRMANDFRDKRNTLLTELAEYIDVKSFEQDNGALTVVSARGCVLVQDVDSYALDLGGISAGRVMWQGSGVGSVDMTDYISGGKLGGSLDMRDEIIEKYQLDLNAFAQEFIWAVNQQHSQGVGLAAFSSVTGDYPSTSAVDAVGTVNSGLAFYDKIVDGSFTLWLYDVTGNVVGGTVITIDADVTPLSDADALTNDIVSQLNVIDANLSATVNNNRLEITAAGGYTFAFSDDSSKVLAALGINNFFVGTGAGDMDVSARIGSDMNLVAAGRVNGDGTFSLGNNSTALAISDLQHATMVISRWTCDRIGGNTAGNVTTGIEDYYHSLAGSVGITVSGISSAKAYNELMVSKISEIRNSVSGVSLDEEMANLMQYQHAYVAASKLISTADEMLQTLLELK